MKMKPQRTATIGLCIDEKLLDFENTTEYVMAFLGRKNNFVGRMTLALIKYLAQYSKEFDSVSVLLQRGDDVIFSNSPLTGLIEPDIDPEPYFMTELTAKESDFAYPFGLLGYTFMIQKPEYKPQIFDIFRAFSHSVWAAIVLASMLTSLVYYVTKAKKRSFQEILLHVWAILLRQNPILEPSSMAEKLLFWFWVAGAMFLGLAYTSVFLSFLAVPPVSEVKNIDQLAAAVEKGLYQCVTMERSFLSEVLYETGEEAKMRSLAIIGSDINKNGPHSEDLLQEFFRGSKNRNIALISDTETINIYSTSDKFIPEDHFIQGMTAMPIEKGFCCKKLLETFVHRLLGSGLYSKYYSDERFFKRLSYLKKSSESDSRERKLTLTDVAPAFIFLLTGYFISFLVFVGEVLLNCMHSYGAFRLEPQITLETSRTEPASAIPPSPA